MLAILRAVECVGAHKATGWKQSIYLSWLLLLIFFFLTIFLNLLDFILFYSATMGTSNEFIVPTRSSVWELQASQAHLWLQEQGVVGVESQIGKG
jgi:hypothetical protein